MVWNVVYSLQFCGGKQGIFAEVKKTRKYKSIIVGKLWRQWSALKYLHSSGAIKCAFDQPDELRRGPKPGTWMGGEQKRRVSDRITHKKSRSVEKQL